ncbi:hypothetical protein DFH94DRAFT_481151 [Russula ochroleuca]|uniref:Uncharacterized protein n=1 Tax=Russula ochroleuca TaxID=152965 RepID=A0A9P5MWM0_9AGAM|nr:hypothetical protein DFH94DRAFT_481151 [Russula ochroleuca]
MSPLLANYSFLSPLKRQRAVRNRSNNNPTTPSKLANRLPVVPELSGEHDDEPSSPCSASASSSSTASHSTSPKAKRLSRYGKDQFGAFGLTDDFLSAPPRAAPQPPSSPSSPSRRSSSSSTKKMRRKSVCLSAFDIIIDISPSEPASPVSETPAEPSTPPRPRDLGRRSPPRSLSPTPSLTSMSACSSTEMPTTPGASDDEWPGLRSPSSDKMAISKHPLMLIKSSPSLLASDENSEDTFEFTLVPFSPLSGLEAEGKEDQGEDGEREEEDDVLWYSRELSEVISLSSPRAPSNSPTRPDSLVPLPRGSSSGTDRPSAHSRMSKPLPAVPHTPLPNPHLDPTYPQYPTLPPRLTLHASAHPSTPPSPLSLPSPVAPTALHKRKSRRMPPPSTPPTSPLPACKSLTITVPRASRRNSRDIVSEILNDVNAWSLGTPSTSTGSSTRTSTLILSPPRIPHSPAVSVFSEYDPVEFIVSYAAARSPSPAPASATLETTFAATFLELEDDGDGDDEDAEAEAGVTVANDDCKLRSRWSCSTLATLAAPSSPTTTTSASPSARFRFHLASVARLVRARRAGGNNNNNNKDDNNSNSNGNGNGCGETVARTMHVRSSSESALSGSSSGSVSGTAF